ncbi:MAG: bifunctional chorismate mutase/prephenate dehydratase [Chloroflexi bacterium 44-23]|nr:MAG: bifunctional chorismate mutase/prephenate dehydratase [Chloroflexi bacterium 44-23]
MRERMTTRVAFQGEHGAYSEQAIWEHFGRQVEAVPCNSFDDVFLAVENQDCEFGCIPVENSVAGTIHRNYDLQLKFSLFVVGEHIIRISHCLIGLPDAELDDIRKVISHPQALAQCEQFLRNLDYVQTEPVYDTAGSIKIMQELGDPQVAAIASRWAAELYKMKILKEMIEDSLENFTRFQIISREEACPTENAKTSLVFSLQNEPGALFRAMAVFALRNIDLTKLESRPIIGKPWEYMFYIDFIGAQSELNAQHALANLSEFASSVRVLGSYPRYERSKNS